MYKQMQNRFSRFHSSF